MSDYNRENHHDEHHEQIKALQITLAAEKAGHAVCEANMDAEIARLRANVTAWQRQAFEHTCSTPKCNCGVGIATHRFDCPALNEAIERGD